MFLTQAVGVNFKTSSFEGLKPILETLAVIASVFWFAPFPLILIGRYSIRAVSCALAVIVVAFLFHALAHGPLVYYLEHIKAIRLLSPSNVIIAAFPPLASVLAAAFAIAIILSYWARFTSRTITRVFSLGFPSLAERIANAIKRKWSRRELLAIGKIFLSIFAAGCLAYLALAFLWTSSFMGALGFVLLGTVATKLDKSMEAAIGLMFWSTIPLLAFLVMSILAAALLRFARRSIRAIESDRSLKAKEKVLFLRSFSDDAMAVRPTSWLMNFQMRKLRLEEALSPTVNSIGNFIGIGVPGERLPLLGARRYYFEDHDWKEAVLKFMAESRVIVMIAGTSSSCLSP